MPNTVSIVKQANYERKPLEDSLRRAILLCGFDLNCASGKRVLLKPNCLGPFPSSMRVTSEPAFVAAVAHVFSSAGAKVFMGDSPGMVHLPKNSFESCGLMELTKNAGIKYVSFEASGSRVVDEIPISNAVFEFDLLVNLPRFKTHSLTGMSLAVKNLFGCVNGMKKATYHYELSDRKKFCELMVRIARAVRPSLNIIDAVIGMEGNGPSAGKPVSLGFIAASQNPHSLDAVCARIAGINPQELETISAAERLLEFDPREIINVVGETITAVKPRSFQMPDTFGKGTLDLRISKLVMKLFWQRLSCQPVIREKKCTKCLICKRSCPAKAIEEQASGYPLIRKPLCIQCYCCHEVCPYQAIDIKNSLLAKMGKLATAIFTRLKSM